MRTRSGFTGDMLSAHTWQGTEYLGMKLPNRDNLRLEQRQYMIGCNNYRPLLQA